MVRTLPPVPSTLRNRNRINNKSRLKIVHGNFDADSIIPDEDEERHRLQQSVLGVDQDDANEHHLQAVLSEAALRSSRVSDKKELPAAYIPTPDSTGLVANYDELYPQNKWKDPATYIYSSLTTEESCDGGLAHGFTYYMDERDKEWLDKNNELARGEGTSAQGALSGTRTSARSAKAKGKEPESAQVVISEDAFELVMGLFEKTTHEKTEFLHHSLDTGMTFPAFTEYQDVFTSPLSASTFAAFAVPSWIPPPAQLSRIARVVYPYWKNRRLERSGHRIIPTLNFDETDTPNESYVCFRRREIKAVRKTRATQVTTSDKLSRLQAEFAYPLQLAETVLMRENLKKDQAKMSQYIWEKRAQIADLKRKNPTVGERGDEELLIDKERPVKKVEPLRPKNQQKMEQAQPARQAEAALRPKDRLSLIHANTESLISRQKEKDHNWEDYLDCAYQSTPASFASRLFKFIPPSEAPTWPKSAKEETPSARPVRLRYGRGGRLVVDRRRTPLSTIPERSRIRTDPDAMDVDDNEDEERKRRLAERWRFDSDDAPSVGPWAEEQDRVLVDDYSHKNILHTMSLLVESDHQYLNTNQSLMITNSEGQQQLVVPYRLGAQAPLVRGPPSAGRFQGGVGAAAPLPIINGAPVSISHQMRMQPNQMRVASNGAMRVAPVVASMVPTPSQSPPRSNSTAPVADTLKPDPVVHVPNGIPQTDGNVQQEPLINGHANLIARPKSTQEQPAPVQTNGYHIMPNGYTNSAMATNAYLHHLNGQTSSTLSAQQMQNLKTAFAAPAGQDANGRAAAPFMSPNANFNVQLASNANLNLKLPPARQMQWTGSLQRPNSVTNGLDAVVLNGSISPTPTMGHTVPRTPSANGSRAGMRVMSNGQLGTHSLSPHHQHSPSPIPSIAQSQSPPRLPQTPTMAVASPSMQH